MWSDLYNYDYIFLFFQAKGKIIVYNQQYVSYGKTVQYRALGAREAAKVGGVASLIRSVTPFSIYSPHTGWQVLKQFRAVGKQFHFWRIFLTYK